MKKITFLAILLLLISISLALFILFANEYREYAPIFWGAVILLSFFMFPVWLTIKEDIKTEHKYYFEENIEAPVEIRTAIQQYLFFFKEYVKAVKNVEIEFHATATSNGIKLMIEDNPNLKIEDINKWFKEYIEYIGKSIEDVVIENDNNMTKREIEVFKVKLENQINHLKNSLNIAKLENNFLKKDNEFLQRLALAFTHNAGTIHHQIIHGGEQQFANKIKNNDNENH